jgi:hypothetical protein
MNTNFYDIFIDINNTAYVPETDLNRVQVWLEGNATPSKTFYGNLISPYTIFATIAGDVYIDNGASNGEVVKWTLNGTNSTTAMFVNGSCLGLFVDINDDLYCCIGYQHQVLKKLFNDSTNTSTMVAGNGTAGSASNMLNNPRRIFVDIEFNLYVADSDNNRVQVFRLGELNGTTVAGTAPPNTITLNCPIGVVLDSEGYLFISDTNDNRIVGSGPNGFRCIVGCLNAMGSASNQLNSPPGIRFDSYGNLYVVDQGNARIQIFSLEINTCGEYD